MIVSINEIEGMTTRACVGAGLGHGLGRELAYAAVVLLVTGLIDTQQLGDILSSAASDTGTADCQARRRGRFELREVSSAPLCAVRAGPSAFDLLAVAATQADSATVEINFVRCPVLLAGFALAAWRSTQLTVLLDCRTPAGEPVLQLCTTEGRLTLACARDRDLFTPVNAKLTNASDRGRTDLPVVLTEVAFEAAIEAALKDGLEVSEAGWRTLGTFAARTYVPETEASRSRGAGAGNIDTD